MLIKQLNNIHVSTCMYMYVHGCISNENAYLVGLFCLNIQPIPDGTSAETLYTEVQVENGERERER